MPDKTNQSDLDALIDDCLEGRLSEPNAAKLSAHLEHAADARTRYWEAASIHGLLEHVMQNASLRAVTGQALPIVSRAQRWLQWRPLTAAAMGLVIGLFSASVVFGFVVQRGMGKKVPLMVFEPGFENPQMSLVSGFAGGPAQWSGDAAHVVAAENGVPAKEATFMLRLEPMRKGVPRIYQVLDLQSLPSGASGESREIEVSASFAARAADATAARALGAGREARGVQWATLRSVLRFGGYVCLPSRYSRRVPTGGIP